MLYSFQFIKNAINGQFVYKQSEHTQYNTYFQIIYYIKMVEEELVELLTDYKGDTVNKTVPCHTGVYIWQNTVVVGGGIKKI